MRLIQPNGRHAFARPAVADHSPDQTTFLIMPDERGAKQIRAFR
jgi:hypothetical protein